MHLIQEKGNHGWIKTAFLLPGLRKVLFNGQTFCFQEIEIDQVLDFTPADERADLVDKDLMQGVNAYGAKEILLRIHLWEVVNDKVQGLGFLATSHGVSAKGGGCHLREEIRLNRICNAPDPGIDLVPVDCSC